jgi:hypothetical protein
MVKSHKLKNCVLGDKCPFHKAKYIKYICFKCGCFGFKKEKCVGGNIYESIFNETLSKIVYDILPKKIRGIIVETKEDKYARCEKCAHKDYVNYLKERKKKPKVRDGDLSNYKYKQVPLKEWEMIAKNVIANLDDDTPVFSGIKTGRF